MADQKVLTGLDVAGAIKTGGSEVYHPGNPPPGGSAPSHISATGGAYSIPGPLVTSARNTQPLLRDRLVFFPFFCDRSSTVTELMANCSTGQAGSTTRLGICVWDHVANAPGALVTDFGSVATDTTGAKVVSGSAALVAGTWYAFMLISGGGSSANAFSNLVGSPPNDTRVKTAGTNFTSFNYAHIDNQASQRTGGFSATQAGTISEQYGYMAGSYNMVFCTFT